MSKTLDRISALLAQAEGASTQEEADAYMSKAQELATTAQVELEVARQHQADKSKREQPEQRTIPTYERYVTETFYSEYYGENRTRRVYCKRPQLLPQRVFLFGAIAGANSVKYNIAHDSHAVYAFGMPSDIEVCEALFASLLLQMQAAADKAIAAGEHKGEKVRRWDDKSWSYVEKPVDARVFRRSFYDGFVSAIGTRLREARKQALLTTKVDFVGAHADGDQGVSDTVTGAELVLRGKEVEVQDFYKATSTARGSYRGGAGATGNSARGQSSGRAAAARANLGTAKALGSTKAVSR